MKKISLLSIFKENQEQNEDIKFIQFLMEGMKKSPHWTIFSYAVTQRYKIKAEKYVFDGLQAWLNSSDQSFKNVQLPATQILEILIQQLSRDLK